MAQRPIFIADKGKGHFVDEAMLSIQWNAGFAESQKKKNIEALHRAASVYAPDVRVLEISTKSSNELGRALSAFNLSFQLPDENWTKVECAYQGSKVFERGGPFSDLYRARPLEAKRDMRLLECGKLVGFEFFGQKWDLQPQTAFYDWLYIQALHQSEWAHDILSFDGFTDIEFNPKKSFNCQARAVAMYVGIVKRYGKIDFSPEVFTEYYGIAVRNGHQMQLI